MRPPAPAPATRHGGRRAAWAYLALALPFGGLLARNLALDLRFEDALITLRYAHNLVVGEGLVFNPGERVLGFSTPLHTLLSALYVAPGREAGPAIQNLAGLVLLLLGGLMVLLLARRLGHPWLGLGAAMLTLTNFTYNYLYFGMEVHLLAFLVLLAFYLHLEARPVATGLVLGLAFLARHDAALLAGLVGASTLLTERRPPLRLATAFLAVVSPWLLFAWLYYGSVLPTALAAKAGRFGFGEYVGYVFLHLRETFAGLIGLYLPWVRPSLWLATLFLVPVAAGVAVAAARDRRFLALGLYPLLHVAAYAVIGSHPGFTWHHHVVKPIAFLFFALGAYHLVALALRPISGPEPLARPRPRLAAAVTSVLFALPLLAYLAGQATYRYQLDPHTRQLYRMAGWLDERYPAGTSLLHREIGVLGYATDLRIIDHAGLVTPGLYYFDEGDATPMATVLERHDPDLLLLATTEPGQDLVRERGYRPVHRFDAVDGAGAFRLYERERP